MLFDLRQFNTNKSSDRSLRIFPPEESHAEQKKKLHEGFLR